MNIFDEIRRVFRRGSAVLFDGSARGFSSAFQLECRNYARMIWYNICDILTDLAEGVNLEFAGNVADTDALYKFSALKAFFYRSGKSVLQCLFDDGFVVIGYNGVRFWQLGTDEYTTIGDGKLSVVQAYDKTISVYVMRSSTYVSRGCSDYALAAPFLKFIDDVLNASATISRRLGAVVVASPKNLSNAPTSIVLPKEEKERLEKEMREQYGSLDSQSNVMLMPREMAFQVINLAGLELKMQEKLRTAILALADRVKVPANQIAIIDANSNKALSNGSELREGDKAKYKSFRRLFEHTFGQMCEEMNVQIRYAIDGEPMDEVTAQVLS